VIRFILQPVPRPDLEQLYPIRHDVHPDTNVAIQNEAANGFP